MEKQTETKEVKPSDMAPEQYAKWKAERPRVPGGGFGAPPVNTSKPEPPATRSTE